MKEERSQLIPQKYFKNMRIIWKIICQNLGNIEEMDKFLETHKLPKLKQEEIESLKRTKTTKKFNQ